MDAKSRFIAKRYEQRNEPNALSFCSFMHTEYLCESVCVGIYEGGSVCLCSREHFFGIMYICKGGDIFVRMCVSVSANKFK